jgi:MFS family permease
MSEDLPDSGEPGLAPPAPGSLPRPAMWPDSTVGAPFSGAEDDTATPPSPGRRKLAYAGVAAMILAVVLVGLAVVTTSWVVLAVGLVIGLAGAVVAVRAGIMEDVSVSDSPHTG